jgi:hypothetical protein
MDIGQWIYDLTPREFQELVADLLRVTGFSNVRSVDGPEEEGIDILAEKNGETIAVEVKLRKEVRAAELERFIGHFQMNDDLPRNAFFVTSARIDPHLHAVVENATSNLKVRLIGIDELRRIVQANRQVLEQHQVLEKFSIPVQHRQRSSKVSLLISSAGVVISILAVLLLLTSPFNKHAEPLDKQIQTVESALNSVRGLETDLANLKEDMAAKQKATQEINEKYAKAKELDKLTDAQLEALKTALQTATWWKTLLQYGIGFTLGISSSFVASILYSKWKQRKALSPK